MIGIIKQIKIINKNKLFRIFQLSVLLLSCNPNKKFNKALWTDDVHKLEYRRLMINDLMVNEPLKGKHYKQIIDLLGKPENKDTINKWISNMYLRYTLEESQDRFEVYTPVVKKEIVIKFSGDSIVEEFSIADYWGQKNWDE